MSIGDPIARPDGRAKVTGRAKYTADHSVAGVLHAVYVGAPIPAGRVAAIEIAPALAAPGVVCVLTHRDLPRLASSPTPPLASSFMPTSSPRSDHLRLDHAGLLALPPHDPAGFIVRLATSVVVIEVSRAPTAREPHRLGG